MGLRWVALLALLLCAVTTTPTWAQAADNATQASAASAPATLTHYSLPPDKLDKAHALYTIRTTLHFVETVYGIVLLLVILRSRVAVKFRRWAERVSEIDWLKKALFVPYLLLCFLPLLAVLLVTRKRFKEAESQIRVMFVQALIVVPLISLIIDLCTLPFGIYSHSVSVKYGLSIQRWGSWYWDWTKGELIGLIAGSVGILFLYWLIRTYPTRWWFYAWLLSTPFMVLVIWAVPVVLDPMFNKFEPLAKDHVDLVQATHRVADAAHVEIGTDRMFLMKASEKVTTANAYVTGLGSTKRVVVWDTTTQQMNVPQTTFVIAHEMGHYVLNHIYKGLAFGLVLMFFGFYLAYRVINWLVARWGTRLGIGSVGDWASLPALMLILSVFGFVAEPIGSTFSRTQIEHKADVYGLEITSQITPEYRQVAAQAFQTLGEHALSYPYPSKLMVFWLYDHPDISSRVDYALHYQPGDK